MKTDRTYYEEALRYINKAEEQLIKAGKDGNYYTDLKYVKSAGGIAYAGVEKAAKWYIELNGKKLTTEANDREIRNLLSKINKKAYTIYADLYSYLLLAVYHNGNNSIYKITESLKNARMFIAYLKPYDKVAVYKKGGSVKKSVKTPTINKPKPQQNDNQ